MAANEEETSASLSDRKSDSETEIKRRLAADTSESKTNPSAEVNCLEMSTSSDANTVCKGIECENRVYNNNNNNETNLMIAVPVASSPNVADFRLNLVNASNNSIANSAKTESGEEDSVFTFRDLPKSSQKSVCFHSVTANPGEKKITSPVECVRFMMNGITLIKVKSNTRQYRRYFSLEEDLSAIRWVPSSKKSSKAKLNIRSVREVRTGKNTEVLKMKEICGAYAENCAFSIIFGDEFESLDLIASTPEEANAWVTGINYLIGASKSADAIECRQTMREKWLHEVFDEADADRKGLLDECEAIALMKKLNSQLCIRELKQKMMEFDSGKDEEERGRINKKSFVTLFKETSTRPDVYFILVRYCGKDLMSIDDLQLFLEGEEGICGTTVEDCETLICKYERSEDAIRNKQLLIDGFTQLLLSEECDISNAVHKQICQDMTQPLSHYFIATSHNTYLVEDQLKGPSSLEGYAKALQQSCRCIKVDCWDGVNGPVVYHGNTLTSKLAIEDVFRTINDYAFVASEYPLIIHLENHCSLHNQVYIASLIKQTFEEKLYTPDKHTPTAFNCLEELKGKIIIQGKKLSSFESGDGEVSEEDESGEHRDTKECLTRVPLSKQISDITSLIRSRCYDLSVVQTLRKDNEVSYFNEACASKLALACTEELVHHNKSCITQVAPDVSRVDSSNVNPFDFWNCGCQLVAMNYQTGGQMMDFYRGWFRQNGNCGYVLKPAFLRERFCLFNARRKDSLPGVDPLSIRLKIISGQQLPRPRGASSKASAIDPYIAVQVSGVPADCAELRTRTVSNEGNSPIFDETFEFSVSVPELALIRFVVLDDDYINDDFIGQNTIALECIQTGYRHVKLYANDGSLIPNATLFVHVSMTHRFGIKQKLRRKRSWSSKQASDLRAVGVKQIDESFKISSNLITESIQIRKEVERTMIDLCDECSLQESANVAQCLRIFVLRLASCLSVTQIDITTSEHGFATLKVNGELTGKLSKSMIVLEKALSEFYFASKNANRTLQMMDESHDIIVKLGDELSTLCLSYGIKGRKADKVAENYIWNLSVLKTEMDMLRSTKEDCECALLQVQRLAASLKRIFERERESITKSSKQDNSITVPPVLLTGATLLPEPAFELRQPPLTPTSPGDARLRGILKKSTPAMSPCTDTPSQFNSSNNEDKSSSDLGHNSDSSF